MPRASRSHRRSHQPAEESWNGRAVEVVFQTLNRYLGVTVGERLGYLLTGLWTALAGTLVPFSYIGWSIWLLALGIGLLITA